MGRKPQPKGNPQLGRFVAGGQELQPPSMIEQFRQAAIVSIIIGIRRAIATVNILNPNAVQAITNDDVATQLLLAQGNYDRAFEVATGFAEYFDIKEKGDQVGSHKTEIAAVMMGQATGFNQVVESAKGESRDGDKLEGIDRFATGLEGLTKVASTAMTVAGGVEMAGDFAATTFGPPRVVSPIYRIAGRDIVIVETSAGRQAFYRSSGVNSGRPGQWFPVDEFRPADGWFNKAEYTQGPGLEEGTPLHRLGTKEFARVSKKLGEMSIPKGQQVPAGKTEVAQMTLNRILDFFGVRTTPSTMTRPVPEK